MKLFQSADMPKSLVPQAFLQTESFEDYAE
jgi:hypothetical protein